ncbi:MAG TPA: hypothetical protein VK174_03425 [Chitinophagales bacterium]|nr:hypothetical protein [Chitinophagales bacterium]
MMMKYTCIIAAAILFFTACNQMPGEVRMNQLAAVRYYKEEDRGNVVRKTHFYYKPNIYMYGGKPYTGKVKEYSEKNEVKSEGFMKDGFPEGYWVYYNTNGTVKSEGYYKDGAKDSLWHDNYTDGSPKLLMHFSLKNDSLQRDTMGAWFYGGQKIVETIGDTTKRYYKTGRLMVRTIRGAEKSEEVFYSDGTLIYKKDRYTKDSYYTNGKLRSRTYYLQDKSRINKVFAEKSNWTAEEKDAVTKADSVQFDYSSLWDPVMKIYMQE